MKVNNKQFVDNLKKKAGKGDLDAQYDLAWHYIGKEGDPKAGYLLLLDAAQKGHTRAQVGVGWCLDMGVGVEKDSHKAIEAYKKAARKNNAPAQFNLWLFYINHEISPDKKKARYYLKK
ncbi:MAG: sel1 repeat family protein [bacterium]|nr:sel1 repeat family protein [bacterium]